MKREASNSCILFFIFFLLKLRKVFHQHHPGKLLWLEILCMYQDPQTMTTLGSRLQNIICQDHNCSTMVTTLFKHYNYSNVADTHILQSSTLNTICLYNIQTPTECNLLCSMFSYFVKHSFPKLHAFPDNQIFLSTNQTLPGLSCNAILFNF